MINKELLDLLCCPKTQQNLSIISQEQVNSVNSSIESGTLVNVGGEKVEEKIESGLIREDGMVIYPIRDEIPIMLIDEGLNWSNR